MRLGTKLLVAGCAIAGGLGLRKAATGVTRAHKLKYRKQDLVNRRLQRKEVKEMLHKEQIKDRRSDYFREMRCQYRHRAGEDYGFQLFSQFGNRQRRKMLSESAVADVKDMRHLSRKYRYGKPWGVV